LKRIGKDFNDETEEFSGGQRGVALSGPGESELQSSRSGLRIVLLQQGRNRWGNSSNAILVPSEASLWEDPSTRIASGIYHLISRGNAAKNVFTDFNESYF
jgi:hypothetical protein